MKLPPEQHHEDCDYRNSSAAVEADETFGVPDGEKANEVLDCNLGCKKQASMDWPITVAFTQFTDGEVRWEAWSFDADDPRCICWENTDPTALMKDVAEYVVAVAEAGGWEEVAKP